MCFEPHSEVHASVKGVQDRGEGITCERNALWKICNAERMEATQSTTAVALQNPSTRICRMTEKH